MKWALAGNPIHRAHILFIAYCSYAVINITFGAWGVFSKVDTGNIRQFLYPENWSIDCCFNSEFS